jgi:hypothetical protein
MYVASLMPGYWRTCNTIGDDPIRIITTVEWVPPARKGPRQWIEDDTYKHYREYSEMKRRKQEDQKRKGKYESSKEPTISKFPTIDTYMGDLWYDDGKAREPSKLTITLNASGVTIVLTDPDERCSAYTTGETLHEALGLLEDALASGKDPWRPWPKSFGNKKG